MSKTRTAKPPSGQTMPPATNGRHPASPPLLVSSSPVLPSGWIEITGKRKQTVRVRISAIAAVWEDHGMMDGPFFVQVAGRTFHPDEKSFAALCICIRPST